MIESLIDDTFQEKDKNDCWDYRFELVIVAASAFFMHQI
jgi:hypothetical protein